MDRDRDGVDDRAEGAGKGAGIGAGVGGAAGLLAGLGLLAIPGLGRAAAGAATGGIVGALTEAGVSEEEAHSYAEGVRRGGTLVSARVADARARLDSILNESAVNLRDRSAAWQKTGWKSFDPSSKPYGADEVRKERQLYGVPR